MLRAKNVHCVRTKMRKTATDKAYSQKNIF